MTVPEKLIDYGLAQGFGVFFVLFVVLAVLFWRFIESIMQKNDSREKRYITVIEMQASSLSKVAEVKLCMNEARKDIEETKTMIGRVLDRLPAKGE